MNNPIELLDTLTEPEITARLDALDREREALRVLLRAVQRRERPAPRRTAGPPAQEAGQ